MERVTAIYQPGDYPDTDNAQRQHALAELFHYLFPNQSRPRIDEAHRGIAIAARNPKLALALSQMSRLIALDLEWCQRADLRELAIQTVNAFYGSHYSFDTRMATAQKCGVTIEQQQAIKATGGCLTDAAAKLFNQEQRTVITYTLAVVKGSVSDAQFQATQSLFGETGMVEMTSVISFFAFWAMFLKATLSESEKDGCNTPIRPGDRAPTTGS